MRKSFCPFVEQASAWSNDLVLRETRGPGDTPNAMARIARRYGIPRGTIHSLRYRKPKAIAAGAFAAIRSAYEAECERQMRRLAHEIEITRAVAGPDCDAVRASAALVGARDE